MTVVNTNIAETINITTNGQYDVARYTTANVNTPAAPAHYVEKAVDANGKLVSAPTLFDFTGITDIGNYQMYRLYKGLSNFTGAVDMSGLTKISGSNACVYAFMQTGISSADLSSVTEITGTDACRGMFCESRSLTSVNFSSLRTACGLDSLCGSCTSLTSVDFSSLETLTNTMSAAFWGCTSLQTLTFPALKNCQTGYEVFGGLCQGCTSLTTLSFPALTSTSFGSRTDQFNSMLSGCTGVTVHFPSNLQSVIGSWSSVTSGFGGTNTTVAFDLPATE